MPEIRKGINVSNLCVTCANELDAGAKFCPECGTPVAISSAEVSSHRGRELLVKLTNELLISAIVQPNTYGQPALEELLTKGDYAQGTADFETFFEQRPPLTVTVAFLNPENAKQTFEQFLGGCGQNVLGYVEFDGGILCVSASYERDLALPNGLSLFATSLRGTVELLLGETQPGEKDNSNFMYKASEDILEIFEGAGLVTTPISTPGRYELEETVESSVFKFAPNTSTPDDFIVGSIYVGVPAKGMFGFDERTNQAQLADENWVIELSSDSLRPSEFAALVSQYQAEVGGTVKSLT
jgi:hypothetical protein